MDAICNDAYEIDDMPCEDESYRDLWIINYNKKYKTQTNVRGVYLFSTSIDSATTYNLKHTYWRWTNESETVKEKKVVYYYIEVVAPTGITNTAEALKK